MKTLKEIFEGILDKDNKTSVGGNVTMELYKPDTIDINDRNETSKMFWKEIPNLNLKKYQKLFLPGYAESLKRNPRYDAEDALDTIRYWENKTLVFDRLSMSIIQFGSCPPIISISLHGSQPNEKYGTFTWDFFSITCPWTKERYTETELINIAASVMTKIKEKTTKAMKYMIENWTVINQYCRYEDFMKSI